MSEARSSRRHPGWIAGFGWLTGLSVAAVLAINLAGIGGIAVARRGMSEEAERVLRLETAARARRIESILASTRGDLAFMTGSPIFFGLEKALLSRDPREARWRRLEAEGAFLLFLRGHPEVAHLVARSERGTPLVEAGRRGGIPVLWVSTAESEPGSASAGPSVPRNRPGAEDHPARAGLDPVPGRVTGLFEFTAGVRKISGAATLEATIDARRLLAPDQTLDDPMRACLLADGDGAALAGGEPQATPGARRPVAVAPRPERGAIVSVSPVETEGWSAPSPWRLTCVRRRDATVALIEPLANRYRTILVLNLVVMSLTILLGAFAIQQTRRRQRVEAEALREARERELERQLFHAERLSTVGRLAAGMAHEINNPLEGMSNYLGLAREDLGRGDAAAAHRRLDGVQEGLQRVVGIVRQVLAHADPATAPKSPVDLNTVLLHTVEFVRSRPEFRAVRFEPRLHGEPLRVLGRQTLLGQVFLNLLLNACEAQPQGGEVTVASRREGREAVIEIADRGPGVPESDSARIFEPFYSTKQSTGLGLSICYAIVRQHDGELGVAARPEGGAVFTLRFPMAERDEAGAPGRRTISEGRDG
ncbi:MAG TPA: ATP-binding protein [Candidatus Polarisedimenticolia bacterium]|nr:ATP-binding protein [Candidatus Polarisedimenticolia bacterium]